MHASCRKHFLFPLMLGALFFTLAQNVHAQKKWDGGANSSSWYDAANWNPNGVPTSTDSVTLDNSLKTSSYSVDLPTGLSYVEIKRLSIRPDSNKTITVTLPSGSTALTGIRIGDDITATRDIIIWRGGVLINNAAGTDGAGIQLHKPENGLMEIQNGGKYIHRTKRPADLASRLSTAAGTEKGIFEYDVPFEPADPDYQIPSANISYGTLVLREASSSKYVTAASSSSMTIRGDLQITGGFELDLSGTVFLAGNLTVGGSLLFGAGTQTVELNGTTKQTIDASNQFISFENLTINNPGGIEIKKNVNVDGTLKLSNGNIMTGLQTLQHGITSEKLLLRIAGWINGNFARYINASTGYRLFPLGTATDYRGIELNYTSAPTAPGLLSTTVIPINPGSAGLPLYDQIIVLVNIAPVYWSIDASGGITGGVYTLTLNTVNLGGVTNQNKLRIVKRDNSGSWFLQGTAGTNGITSVTRDGMSGFSEFGIAGTVDNPLPVELSSFTAQQVDERVTLKWTTETEDYVKGFVIERMRVNGNEDWQSVGFVPARGCCSVSQNYSFIDAEVENHGKACSYFYRLRILDYDGSVTFSPLAKVTLIPDSKQLFLDQNYPNPISSSTTKTTIAYYIPTDSHVTLTMHDMLGKEITVLVNSKQQAGAYSAAFDASSLTAGMYFYKLTAAGSSVVKKMIVGR